MIWKIKLKYLSERREKNQENGNWTEKKKKSIGSLQNV